MATITKETKVSLRNSLRFVPEYLFTFKFVASNYSAVFKVNKEGELVPFYGNLEGVFNDLKAFNHGFSAYDMRQGDDRKHAIEILVVNPDYTELIEAWKKLGRLLTEHDK